MPHVLPRTWSVTWRIGLLLVLWGTLYAPFVLPYFLYWTEHELLKEPQGQLFIELSCAATVFLAAWAMVRFVDRRPLAALGVSLRNAPREFLLGGAVGVSVTGFVILVMFAFGWLKVAPESVLSVSGLLWSAVILLTNTATQELLVRGYMLQAVRSRFSAFTSVVVTSVIFVAMHVGVLTEDAILPAVNLFLAGVMLAITVIISGRLWMAISLHFAWNYLQGPVLGLNVTGQDLGKHWLLSELTGPPIWCGGRFGLEGGSIASIILVVSIAGLLYAFRSPLLQPGRTMHLDRPPRTP